MHHFKHSLAHLLNGSGPGPQISRSIKVSSLSTPTTDLVYPQEMTLLPTSKKIKAIRQEFPTASYYFSFLSPTSSFTPILTFFYLTQSKRRDCIGFSSSGTLHHQFSPFLCVLSLSISTASLPSTQVQIRLIFVLTGEGHIGSLQSYILVFSLEFILLGPSCHPQNCSLLAYSCLPLLEYMPHTPGFIPLHPHPQMSARRSVSQLERTVP